MIQPFELLEKAASSSPDQIGLVSQSRVLTFRQMWEQSQNLATKFQSAGVLPRQVVSTFLPPDLDWLSTLAIFHEAAVPVSLWGVGNVNNLNVSWFVSTNPHNSVPSNQTIILDEALLEIADQGEQRHQRTLFARPDKPMRYVLTSGTTGAPKAVTFTGNNIQARLTHLASYWADSRPEMNFMGLSTTGGFFTALAALQHGYPYICEVEISRSAIERANEYGVKVLAGSPSQVGQALQLMRHQKLSIPSLVEVRVAGSQPSEKLISAIHEQLGVAIKSVYGSTEGGGVAVTMLEPGDNPSDVGELISDIELEIEAESGVPGPIRYRGPGVSPGYLVGDKADSSFVDRWFYPGDIGFVSEQGRLIVQGRSDEILNFGGTKLNPERIEGLAKDFEGVIDVAVCLIEQNPGIEEVAIAVVGSGNLNLRALDQFLRAKSPIGHPTVFTTAHQIPRNRMGKIVRSEIRNQILQDLNLK
jgi:acyl-CoA synthetase (AMP-forming)/AMP-acid ligase II